MNRSIDPLPQGPSARGCRKAPKRWESWRGMLLRAALFAWISGPLTCSGIHDDELGCEEAAAHLRSCCANFDPATISCSVGTSCGNSPHPELALDQSSCILDRSCADLNANSDGKGSLCERANAATANMTNLPAFCP